MPSNSCAVAGFSMSLAAIPCLLLPPLAVVVSGLATIFSGAGLLYWAAGRRGAGFAIPGLVLGAVLLIWSVLATKYFIEAFSS